MLLFAVFLVMYAMGQSDKKKAEEVAQSIQSAFGMAQAGAGGKPVVIQSGAVSIVPEMKAVTSPQRRTAEGKVRQYANYADYGPTKVSIDAYLVKTGASGKFAVEITKRGVVVSLKEAGFFDSGSAHLKKESVETLAAIAEAQNQYANTSRIEGHTDNVPMRSAEFRSNGELPTIRATTVFTSWQRQPDMIRYPSRRWGMESIGP